MDESDRIPILGTDRQAEPLVRQPPDEGDDSGGRSAHLGAHRRADVDPAVLAARVRVVLGDERPEHRALDGPGPRGRARNVREREHHRRQGDHYVARFEYHAGKDTEPIGCCQI